MDTDDDRDITAVLAAETEAEVPLLACPYRSASLRRHREYALVARQYPRVLRELGMVAPVAGARCLPCRRLVERRVQFHGAAVAAYRSALMAARAPRFIAEPRRGPGPALAEVCARRAAHGPGALVRSPEPVQHAGIHPRQAER